MIMRNEGRRLPRVVESVRGLVDEIVVVDTGSTDNSIQVARGLGALVFRDAWRDDYARPRNIAGENASKKWILSMDPDEVVSRRDFACIRAATAQKEIKAFRIETRNYTVNTKQGGFRACGGEYKEEGNWPGYVGSTKTRLYRRDLRLKWQGCYHELLDWDLNDKGVKAETGKWVVHHYGNEINQVNYKEKLYFYLRLGEKKIKEMPGNPQAYWELAICEINAGYVARAYKSMQRSIELGGLIPDRLFFAARLAKQMGKKDISEKIFELGFCKLLPNLTQVRRLDFGEER